MNPQRWMLPDGVEEWLPPDSWRLETLRRRLLDCYRERGFDLVATPIVEHLETLLTGAGFREVGRRERYGHIDGDWRDVLLFERRSAAAGGAGLPTRTCEDG